MIKVLRGLKKNDWVTTICNSIPDVNDKNTYPSWLMYYLGSKNKDEFITTAVKLGYLMLTKNMDQITDVAIW